MLSKLRSHLTYANVIASIALFLVLTGAGAIAATNICPPSTPCVNTDDIINGQVTNPDLGTSAVTAPKIGTAAVTNAKLGTAAVTDVKLGTSAVTAPKIATSAVTNTKLGTAAVSNAKLAAGAVTPAKFGTIPGARAEKTSGQSIPNSDPENPFIILSFESASFDIGGPLHNTTNNDRLTAPITGMYQLSAGVDWADNSTGERVLFLAAGPTTGLDLVADSTTKASAHALFGTLQSVSSLVRLAAGDIAAVFVNQDSGSSQTVQPGNGTFLAMHWVGPG
jgi:hypothetical protein